EALQLAPAGPGGAGGQGPLVQPVGQRGVHGLGHGDAEVGAIRAVGGNRQDRRRNGGPVGNLDVAGQVEVQFRVVGDAPVEIVGERHQHADVVTQRHVVA